MRYNEYMSVSTHDLEFFGLSEKEAKVYLAALEIGRATADQLSKHTKIARPTTYLQIKNLMASGLMSTFEEGKKTYFIPEAPSALVRLLEKKKAEFRTGETLLTSLLPLLTQQYEGAGERPVVRFFPGKDGILTVREEVLKTKKKAMNVIFSPGKLVQLFGDQYAQEYSKKRTALNIHSRAIYSQGEAIDTSVIDRLTERRVFKKDALALSIDIYLFDDKVAIVSLEGNVFGLVIHSAQITESMKAIFEILWVAAGK